MIISASIDLSKLDKSKIKNHENGSKYYPVSIFIRDDKDTYGNDVSICTGQTKEERESNQKKQYIGNGKVVYGKPAAASGGGNDEPQSDLPF